MSEYIDIADNEMAEILDTLFGRGIKIEVDEEYRKRWPNPIYWTSEYPRSIIEGFVQYLKDADLGCDHSVGICTCSQLALLHELNLMLEGKKSCPTCGGDGYLFDENPEEPGMTIRCVQCNGDRFVPRKEEVVGQSG